jgi:hypothetical protein
MLVQRIALRQIDNLGLSKLVTKSKAKPKAAFNLVADNVVILI